MTTYGRNRGDGSSWAVEGSSEGNEGVKSKGRVAQSAISLKKYTQGSGDVVKECSIMMGQHKSDAAAL